MLPVVLAALMLAMTAVDVGYNIYSTNETTKASDVYNRYVGDFYGGAEKENAAYFARYLRAHHLDPKDVKYPFRTGMNFNESQLYAAGARGVSNEYARLSSLMHGATRVGQSASIGAYNSTKTYRPNTMILYPGGGYYGN